MKKYIILYMLPVAIMQEMSEKTTPEEWAKEMEDWTVWIKKYQECFIDEGNPAGKNTRVDINGSAEISNEVVGYSIMQGESKEAILEILKESPHLTATGAYVEVMERIEM